MNPPSLRNNCAPQALWRNLTNANGTFGQTMELHGFGGFAAYVRAHEQVGVADELGHDGRDLRAEARVSVIRREFLPAEQWVHPACQELGVAVQFTVEDVASNYPAMRIDEHTELPDPRSIDVIARAASNQISTMPYIDGGVLGAAISGFIVCNSRSSHFYTAARADAYPLTSATLGGRVRDSWLAMLARITEGIGGKSPAERRDLRAMAGHCLTDHDYMSVRSYASDALGTLAAAIEALAPPLPPLPAAGGDIDDSDSDDDRHIH